MKIFNPRALLANLAKAFLVGVGLGAASVKIWYQSSAAELIPLGFGLVLLNVGAFAMQWSTNAGEFLSLNERKSVYIGSRDCFLASVLSLVSAAFVMVAKSFPLGTFFAQSFYLVHTVFFVLSMLIALWGLSKLLDASISHR
jgi:hypothetical protein